MDSVPKTPVKPKKGAANFNLSKMVGGLFVGRMLLQMCEKAKFTDAESYAAGIVKGYNDWFEELNIDKDVMNMAIKSLDKEACIQTAKDLFSAIADSLKKPLIEIPGVAPVDVKKILDNVNKGKG